MKIIIPVITLLIGFSIGWHFSGKRIQENVKAALPPQFYEQMTSFFSHMEPMTKNEVDKFHEQVRGYGDYLIKDWHRELLWDAINADIYKSHIEKGEEEDALDWANLRLKTFHQQYEKGMDLGDYQKVADAIYTQTKGEPVGAGQPDNPPVKL